MREAIAGPTPPPASRRAPPVLRHGRRGDAQPRLTIAAGRPRRLDRRGSEEAGIDGGGGAAPGRGREAEATRRPETGPTVRDPPDQRGKTVHGEAANAGHRVLAPDDAEVEAYLETALNAPGPDRRPDRPAGDRPAEPDTVVVLDFGSQFAQLIARRVRELNVYSELLPHDTPWSEIERRGPRAIILSGGPNSVYDDDAPRPDPAIWSGAIPVLGICYGAQLMAHELGGDVLPAPTREYGPATVRSPAATASSRGLDRDQPVWMSHGDSITRLPEGFTRPPRPTRRRSPVSSTPARNLYGIQFHPEVVHTPRGRDVLRNFVRRDRRRRRRPGRRPTSSTRPSPRSATASTRHAARDRLGRPRHLRAVGRRRLGRRGGARPSRRRRPADLHLRRPRPDAQEGIGAAASHLRARPRDEPRHGRRPRAVPAPARRRRGPRAEAADHRRRVHPRLRGGGREARPDRLPDPGHALPGRHRDRRRPRRRPPRRSRPTTTSAGCRPTCASS